MFVQHEGKNTANGSNNGALRTEGPTNNELEAVVFPAQVT